MNSILKNSTSESLVEFFCDLSKDHVVIDPRVLSCGLSVCYDCIKTKFKYDEFKKILFCNCCGKEHIVLKLEDLPKNSKIENLIRKNIIEVTGESLKRTQLVLVKSKDLHANRVVHIEEYIRQMKQNVDARIRSIKIELDQLHEQLYGAIDELKKEYVVNAERFGFQMLDQSKAYQSVSDVIARKLKNNENMDLLIDYIRQNYQYQREFEQYEKCFDDMLLQYCCRHLCIYKQYNYGYYKGYNS